MLSISQYDLCGQSLAWPGYSYLSLLTFFAWNSIAHKYMGKIPPDQILKINQYSALLDVRSRNCNILVLETVARQQRNVRTFSRKMVWGIYESGRMGDTKEK